MAHAALPPEQLLPPDIDNDNNDNTNGNDDHDDDDVVLDESRATVPVACGADRCAICLCEPDAPAVADTCFHWFCFLCLYQWANISQRCPLCKRWFGSIIYDIQSSKEFKRFTLEPDEHTDHTAEASPSAPRSVARASRQQQPQPPWGAISPSTLQRHAEQQQWSSSFPFTDAHQRRSRIYKRGLVPLYASIFPSRPLLGRRAATTASSFDITKRRRGSEHTEAMYATDSRRLQHVPLLDATLWATKASAWIERELQAITEEADVSLLLLFVRSIIVRKYAGKLQEHRASIESHLEPYLFEHASSFVSELVCFLASPLSMQAYDKSACYIHPTHRHHNQQHLATSSSSTASTTSSSSLSSSPRRKRQRTTAASGFDSLGASPANAIVLTD